MTTTATNANVPAPLINDITNAVMRRGGRMIGQEIRFSCPNPAGHQNEDAHPSADWNEGKAAWTCRACGDGGGAFDLADRLGIDRSRYMDASTLPRSSSNGRPMTPFESFCRDRHLDQTQLVESFGVSATTIGSRPALKFPTDQGDRIKFLDENKPKNSWAKSGGTQTVYNANGALSLLHAGQSVLFQANGEPSVWACHQAGVAAFTTCAGEKPPSLEIIERVKALIDGIDHPVGIAVVFDRDGVGMQAEIETAEAYRAAGIPAVALMLPRTLPSGGDIDDLHRRVGPKLLDALLALPEIKIEAPREGVNSLFRFSAKGDEETSGETVAPFPVDVLPTAPRQLVSIGADAIGAPPDMIGTPLLAYAAAAIGNRVSIELKRGFTQRAQLYAAVVARPGSAKSPSQDLARAPLDVLQRHAHDRYVDSLERFEDQLSLWHGSDAKDRGPKPERPLIEHFYTTDATIEALAPMAERSPGIAMSRDELVSWVKSCDAYRGGKGGDRQMWLSLWAGSPLKIDRKGSDTTFVPEPSISVIGGIQPDMLGELADEAGRQDGLIDRIIWSFPEPKAPGWTDEVVEQRHIDAVTHIFRQLREAPKGVVRLTPTAKADWVAWFNENAVLTEQASGLTQGVYSKLPNIMARLALILHCLRYPADPAAIELGSETLHGAIELAEYYRSHAHRVLPHFGSASDGRGAGVIQRVSRILDNANGEWVRRTKISNGLGRNVTSDQITEALGKLEERRHAEYRTLPSGERGGRPVEEWRSCLCEITKIRTNLPLSDAAMSSNGHHAEEGDDDGDPF